jgi:bacterioferritin (cytochrome b1)
MSDYAGPKTKFQALLREQIYNEFTSAQQYMAIAVYFDSADLPQLAKRFYSQSVEETKSRDDAGATSARSRRPRRDPGCGRGA